MSQKTRRKKWVTASCDTGGLPYDNGVRNFLRGTSCAKFWKLLQSCISEGHDFRGALDPKTTTSWKPHCSQMPSMQYILGSSWVFNMRRIWDDLSTWERSLPQSLEINNQGKLTGCSTSACCSLRGTTTHKATTSWILSNNCERCCLSKASRSTTWQKTRKI